MRLKDKILEILESEQLLGGIRKNSPLNAIFFGNSQVEGLLDKRSCSCELNNPKIGIKLVGDMKESCLEYRYNKRTIINIYTDLLRRLNLGVELDLPNCNFENSVERQLYLMRFFHPDEKHTIEDALNIFWMYSHERIVDDIKELGNGSLSFLGKRIQIQYDKEHDKVISYSSAHPIIMVENLTQVLIQLEGLKQMAKNKVYRKYAINSAAVIWNQLSDYAKNRIQYVLDELMEVETTFYDELPLDEEYFKDEIKCSCIQGVNGVMNYLKNQKSFYIAYYNDDHSLIIQKHCEILKYTGLENITLHDIDKDKDFEVLGDNIICAAEEKEEFVNYLG